MSEQFDSSRPIYAQLVERLKARIPAGTYPPGGHLDSVRDLAAAAGVNPNTMQRALAQLETEGLVRTERTSGRYVTEDTELIEQLRTEAARKLAEEFLVKMRGIGYSPCTRGCSAGAAGHHQGGCTMSEILTCEALTKCYDKDKTALDGVDLHVNFGRIVGLLGPNGSGKTTLIKLANGLLQPTSGSIKVAGMAPGPDTKALVSYLPDADWLPDWMQVEQLVGMFTDFYADFDPAKAFEMLDALHIARTAKLRTLSKGNKEKVQLILAMSRAARLYLLDEPIGGVDPAARDYILHTIISNYSKDATVILSTHLIGDIEPVLDEAIFLKDGRVFAHRSVEELRETEGHERGCIFPGGIQMLSKLLKYEFKATGRIYGGLYLAILAAAALLGAFFRFPALVSDFPFAVVTIVLPDAVCRHCSHHCTHHHPAVHPQPAGARGLSDAHPAGHPGAAHPVQAHLQHGVAAV